MKVNALRTLIASSVLAFAATGAMAADPASKFDPKKPVQPAVQDKAQTGKADVKVTGDDTKNSTAPAVEKRAGAFSCDIHIDNRTNWYINRVYVDGRNWGSVGRYGDAIARDVATGPTRLYAEVDFSDGSTRYYGPRVFNCNSYSTHRWTLN